MSIHDLTYAAMLKYILAEGDSHADRTGTGTTSVFGYQNRYDLAKGFPLLTTKRMAWKSIVVELAWFLLGRTDNQWLEQRGVMIWKEWATKEQCGKRKQKEGDLGRVYGAQWRDWKSSRLVEVPSRNPSDIAAPTRVEETAAPSNGDRLVGTVVETTYGPARVLAIDGEKAGRKSYRIQFINTLGVRVGVCASGLYGGQVRDLMHPTCFGVGYPGMENATRHPLYQRWHAMIARCYDTAHEAYHNYGGKGVYVCSRWHDFSLFAKDAESIPGFSRYLSNPKEYEIDKDYYSSSVYHPETCVWLHRTENTAISGDSVASIHEDGTLSIWQSKREAERGTEVCRPSIDASIEKGTSFDGYTFTRLDHSVRRSLGIDQIHTLSTLLVKDPNSRRLCVSAWNVDDLPGMALSPCHALFQCKVRTVRNEIGTDEGADRYLDLHLYQRSADSFLGVPFNIASYALLLQLLAHTHDLTPGRFIHTFGDLHIYNNHKDQVNEQLARRDGFDAPTVVFPGSLRNTGFSGVMQWANLVGEAALQPDVKFRLNDASNIDSLPVALCGYKSHDAIKAEVSV